MTTRRQMLKIKVCVSRSLCRVWLPTSSCQGMSEAKVEKIKVTPMYASTWMSKNTQINVYLGSGTKNSGSGPFECMLTLPLITR